MYKNKIKIRITTLDIILHIEWRGKENHYRIEGKVYWQTDILAATDLYLLFLEMCVFAGVCGGQEMDLNYNLGDCELPDVGVGDSAWVLLKCALQTTEPALQPWFSFSNWTFV